MPLLTRRRFLQAGTLAAAGGAAVVADATLIAPNDPQLVRLEIPLARLPAAWDGLRIAQLSDFHYDAVFSVHPIRKAVHVVNDLHPDLILLTGDFVTALRFGSDAHLRRSADVIDPCSSLLQQLRAPMGVLAILGNHDSSTDPARITKTLAGKGIPVLVNRSVSFERAGARLWIAGVDDVIEGNPDLLATLHGIPKGEPVVLMAHEPDFAVQACQLPVDLQLSGHSHGGQVRLPYLGAVVLPDLARLYPWGLRRVGEMTLYTNVGIGTVLLPMRLNCPPEITLITLRAGGGG